MPRLTKKKESPKPRMWSSNSYEPTDEEIKEAAYYRFLNRGGANGNDQDDWLAAKEELKQRRQLV